MESKDADVSSIPLDEDGFPVPGKVIQFYRIRMGWTQEELARRLGITVFMVRAMEQNNQGLDSIKRRRFLCELLNLPPILLGLGSVEHFRKFLSDSEATGASTQKVIPPEIITGVPSNQRETYTSLLQHYIQNHIRWSSLSVLSEIEAIISALTNDVKNTSSKQDKKPLLYLLWEYHRLLVKIYADDKFIMPLALFHLDKALSAASQLHDDNLLAVTYAHQAGLELLQGNAFLARPDIDAALSHAKNASDVVKCDTYALAANVYHASAVLMSDTASARDFLETSQTLLCDIKTDERYVPKTIGEIKCQQTQFDSFLELGRIQEAEKILDSIEAKTPKNLVRKKALGYFFRAKCYLKSGYPDMAIHYLDMSFNLIKDTGAVRNKAEIRDVYMQIKSSSYGNHAATKELGILLRDHSVRG